jgi:hypothetical protein
MRTANSTGRAGWLAQLVDPAAQAERRAGAACEPLRGSSVTAVQPDHHLLVVPAELRLVSPAGRLWRPPWRAREIVRAIGLEAVHQPREAAG